MVIALTGGALTAQGSKPGTYLRMDGTTQGGRPVYQRSGGVRMYLYYWAAQQEWLVGPDYDQSGLRSASGLGSQCPEDAGVWQYYSGGIPTFQSGGVAVSCPSPSSPPWPPSPPLSLIHI